MGKTIGGPAPNNSGLSGAADKAIPFPGATSARVLSNSDVERPDRPGLSERKPGTMASSNGDPAFAALTPGYTLREK